MDGPCQTLVRAGKGWVPASCRKDILQLSLTPPSCRQNLHQAMQSRNCSHRLHPAANRSLDSREKVVRNVTHLCAGHFSLWVRFCHHCVILNGVSTGHLSLVIPLHLWHNSPLGPIIAWKVENLEGAGTIHPKCPAPNTASAILLIIPSISAQAALLLSRAKEGLEKWAQVHRTHISNHISRMELSKDKEFILAAGRTDR